MRASTKNFLDMKQRFINSVSQSVELPRKDENANVFELSKISDDKSVFDSSNTINNMNLNYEDAIRISKENKGKTKMMQNLVDKMKEIKRKVKK